MFKSRLLNSLTRTHPVVPLVLYGPVILALAASGVWRAGVLVAITLMAAGYLTWTLTEYWVHRAVFHFQPRGPRCESFVWMIHGVHHDYRGGWLRRRQRAFRSVPQRQSCAGYCCRGPCGCRSRPAGVAGISPMTCCMRICMSAGRGRR
jgi:dihydroceramide fatty acyl 2-hydroxylase